MTSVKKINVIFFGTPQFALPCLRALIESSFIEVALVVTQPDKPVGRHHSRLMPSPVKKMALATGIEVYDGNIKDLDINRHSSNPHPLPLTACPPMRRGREREFKFPLLPEEGVRGRWEGNADLGIVVAYGEILPKKILDSFPLGVLNIHPSLLPKYRGPSPIQAAILNQDKETGITIIKLDDKMDHGSIVAQKKIKLNKTITADELHDNLAKSGANLLLKILPDYIFGKITPRPQNHHAATYTEKLTKKSGIIDWSKSPEEIDALTRTMNPWPGAWTMWKEKKLIIWRATGRRGKIQLEEVQLEGKKRMPFAEFLKGHSDFIIGN